MTLTALWFLFFLVNLAIVLYLYLDDWIEEDNFRACLTQLNSLYVIYIGVITAFYFTNPNKVTSKEKYAGTAFVVAFLGSAIWNIVIFIFLLRLLLPKGTIEDSTAQIGYFGSLLSWLVAPAIGYYFANPYSDAGGRANLKGRTGA